MYYITGLLGLASIIAPYAFQFSNNTTALLTSVLMGAALVGVSAVEWLAQDRDIWEYWVVGIVGAAAAISPFVLRFSENTTALWTIVAMGLLAVLAAGFRMLFPPTTA